MALTGNSGSDIRSSLKFIIAEIFDQAQTCALPLLIQSNITGESPFQVSLIHCVSSALFLGGVGLGSLKKIRNRGRLAFIATFLSAFEIRVFGLAASIPALATAALINGLFISIFSLVWTITIQELVSRDKLGRVSSNDLSGSFVLLPIGYGISGRATDMAGAPIVFLPGGV